MAERNNVGEYLRQTISSGKVSHAYILSGDAGPRRLDMALNFAGALLCERGGDFPCGTCRACKQIAAGSHPDLIRVTHEKPASIGVDDIRLQVSETAGVRPFSAEKKIYIVDEAEKMTPQAQNALLKTIEEPPAYCVMILLSSHSDALLDTVRSRCIILELDRIEDEGEEEFARIMEMAGDRSKVNEAAAALKDAKQREAFYEFARSWYRDVLVYKKTGDMGTIRLSSHKEDIAAKAAGAEYPQIEKALRAIDKAADRQKFNVNADLSLELMLMALV